MHKKNCCMNVLMAANDKHNDSSDTRCHVPSTCVKLVHINILFFLRLLL